MSKTNSKESRTSGGKRKIQRINQQIRRLNMKVARWERYIEEIKQDKRKGKISRWDTSGLKKHIALLESL